MDMVFGQKLKMLTSAKKTIAGNSIPQGENNDKISAKIIPSERECQEEQNDADFSFIAPSSKDLRSA